MSILFRCDAGNKSGLGHLSRCSVLYKEALKNDLNSSFLVKTDDRRKIESFLDSRNVNPDSVEMLDWDITTIYELDLLKKYVKNLGVNFVVMDHYNTTQTYCRSISEMGLSSLLFDYKAEGQLLSDIVLNPNPGAIYLNYDIMTNSSQSVLSGIRYSLIDEKIKLLQCKEVSDNTPKILFALGGGSNVQPALNYLMLNISEELKNRYHFILPGSQIQARKNHLTNRYNTFESHQQFLAAVESADLVICNAGVTAVEMLYLKKKMIVLDMADNQKFNWRYFKENNGFTFTLKEIAEILTNGVDIFKKCLNRVNLGGIRPDGEGAKRVIAEINKIINYEDS